MFYSIVDFLKRKGDSRKEHFKTKKPKCANKEGTKDVTINIGVMRYVNGTLKTCKGRNLPVSVPPTATRDTILTRAVQKRVNHNRNMARGIKYALLYLDGTEVDTLPGTSTPFVLSKYKDELGKSYTRVTLYIATKCDVDFGVLDELADEHLSSDESESSESVKDLLEHRFCQNLKSPLKARPKAQRSISSKTTNVLHRVTSSA